MKTPAIKWLVPFIQLVSVIALILAGGWAIYSLNTSSENQKQQMNEVHKTYVMETNGKLEQANIEKEKLNNELNEKTQQLKSREGFIAELAAASPLIEEARTKIDISSYLSTIQTAQNIVYEEEFKPTVVEEQTIVVHQTVQKISDLLNSYYKQQKPITPSTGQSNNNGQYYGNPSNCPPLGEGLQIARKALNDVGGGNYCLAASEVVCNNPKAVGCAYGGGKIEVAVSYLNKYSYYDWYTIMLHETAHQVQYSNKILTTPEFKNIFNNDIEWLAECMSLARMPDYNSGYNYSCSQEQLNIAARAWE